jgi:hypothetical protein
VDFHIGMEVEIVSDFKGVDIEHEQFFDGVNFGLGFGLGIQIRPVQIQTLAVEAKVASADAVDVDHGNDFENEGSSQNFRVFVVFIAK